jgi:hydroxyacylglutathione hydrolase
MKRLNKEGPQPVGALAQPTLWHPEQLRAARAAGTPIVDTRPADAFAARALPSAISLPSGLSFLTWAGWLVPYDRPFALIADEEGVADIVAQLRLIGLDHVAGYWTPAALDAWSAEGEEMSTIARIDPADLADLARCDGATIIDVRGASEYAAGHIAGSRNIPLGSLARRLDEVPALGPVVVQCQSGARSAIAASLLAAHGRRDALDLAGGLDAWRAAGLPVERPADTPALAAAR